MRYRVTEGGLEPTTIARGYSASSRRISRRARRVTSHLIMHRGRLGTRLVG